MRIASVADYASEDLTPKTLGRKNKYTLELASNPLSHHEPRKVPSAIPADVVGNKLQRHQTGSQGPVVGPALCPPS